MNTTKKSVPMNKGRCLSDFAGSLCRVYCYEDIESLKTKIRTIVEYLLEYTSAKCPELNELFEFYNDIRPERLTNRRIFAELSWIVYSSGFRFDIVKKYWSSLRDAFREFNVLEVAQWSNDLGVRARRICRKSGFKNQKKARWCIENAKRVVDLDHEMRHLGGLKGYFVETSKKDSFELVNSVPMIIQDLGFKGIGKTTIFHLLKNVGIDIFKPDIHVRRILARLGLIEGEQVSAIEICMAMSLLSWVSDMKLSELDTLLFVYGKATGDNLSISLRSKENTKSVNAHL